MSFASSLSELPLDRPDLMRALSHPTRLRMLSYLSVEGRGTASSCGAQVGLTASAASYHLHLMEKHGLLVKELASKGDQRQTWWRLAAARIAMQGEGDASAGSQELTDFRVSLMNLAASRAVDFFTMQGNWDQQWRMESGFNYSVVYLTSSELANLRRIFDEAIEPFIQRTPAERPASAAAVALIAGGAPETDVQHTERGDST